MLRRQRRQRLRFRSVCLRQLKKTGPGESFARVFVVNCKVASSPRDQINDRRVEDALPSARPSSHKWLVAIAVMLGATLEVLDTSIVNVSLPHMQGSFSASRDEVTWILTCYIVANGIMFPLPAWISPRLCRKRYFFPSR